MTKVAMQIIIIIYRRKIADAPILRYERKERG